MIIKLDTNPLQERKCHARIYRPYEWWCIHACRKPNNHEPCHESKTTLPKLTTGFWPNCEWWAKRFGQLPYKLKQCHYSPTKGTFYGRTQWTEYSIDYLLGFLWIPNMFPNYRGILIYPEWMENTIDFRNQSLEPGDQQWLLMAGSIYAWLLQQSPAESLNCSILFCRNLYLPPRFIGD